MARHNRNAEGRDQAGFGYRISYPPDWLDRIRVTRSLPSGRRSTRTLFRNPQRRPQDLPGELIRLRIESPDQELEVETVVRASPESMREVVLRWRHPRGPGAAPGAVVFILSAFPREPAPYLADPARIPPVVR